MTSSLGLTERSPVKCCAWNRVASERIEDYLATGDTPSRVPNPRRRHQWIRKPQKKPAISQQAGGWNRIILQVADLAGAIEALKKAGLPLRNAMESGPGGNQVQLEDPDGNPIELFEPAQ